MAHIMHPENGSVSSPTSVASTRGPTNAIPNEILIDIFIHLKAQSAPNAPHSWIPVTHVSNRWRAVALAAPVLWNTILISDNLNALPVYLERSRDMPLSIYFYRRQLPASAFTIATHISPHAARVRLLHINHATYAMISFADTIRMPNLRSLLLHSDRNLECEGSFSRSGQYPVLKSLTLQWIMVDGDAPIFNSLTSLKLESIWFSSMDGLLDLLDSCNNLQFLQLLATTPADVAPSARMSSLKNLNGLSIVNIPETTAGILAHIRLPASARVHVKTYVPGDSTTWDVVFAALPADHSVLRFLPLVTGVQLVLDGGALTLSATTAGTDPGAGPASFTLSAAQVATLSTRAPELCAHVAALFADAPVVDLQVRSSGGLRIPETGWLALLRGFPHVERLLDACVGDDDDGVFAALGTDALARSRGTLCPALSSFTIVRSHDKLQRWELSPERRFVRPWVLDDAES